MILPCLGSGLVDIGIKTQMSVNDRTIISTSNPPGYARALLTMVAGDAGLAQSAGSNCRTQTRAWLALNSNYSEDKEQQPQSQQEIAFHHDSLLCDDNQAFS